MFDILQKALDKGEKLGIVGLYDTEDDKNISHTVVDPKFRGQGLAKEFKLKLLDHLNEDYFVATVDLGGPDRPANEASIKALEKIPGIQVVSDKEYEQEFEKRKYRYDKPKK